MKPTKPPVSTEELQRELDLRVAELPGKEKALARALAAQSIGPRPGLNSTQDLMAISDLRRAVTRAKRILTEHRLLIEQLKAR